jgi:hypothetical protein
MALSLVLYKVIIKKLSLNHGSNMKHTAHHMNSDVACQMNQSDIRHDFNKRYKAYLKQDEQVLMPYSYGEMAQKIYHACHKIKFNQDVNAAFEKNLTMITDAVPSQERKGGARHMITKIMALHYTCERTDQTGLKARDMMVSIFGGNDTRRTRLTQSFIEPNFLQTLDSICEIVARGDKKEERQSYLKHAWNMRVNHNFGLASLSL